MDERIKIISHLGISGETQLDDNGKVRIFRPQPAYLEEDGGKVAVGVFYIKPEDKKFIESTDHFKNGMLKYDKADNALETRKDPAHVQVSVGPSAATDPLNMPQKLREKLENAKMVDPDIVSMLLENIEGACDRILSLSADKKEKPASGSEDASSHATDVLTIDSLQELSAQDLKAKFIEYGEKYGFADRYKAKAKKEVNAVHLFELIEKAQSVPPA
jgi:hypothetical protein